MIFCFVLLKHPVKYRVGGGGCCYRGDRTYSNAINSWDSWGARGARGALIPLFKTIIRKYQVIFQGKNVLFCFL